MYILAIFQIQSNNLSDNQRGTANSFYSRLGFLSVVEITKT